MFRYFAAALLAACTVTQAAAEVVSVEVREQRPWIAGRAFGAGEYELLSGVVHYEIDPSARSSRDIADIRLAPRNARGRVEFRGPFLILRPRDPQRANGTTLFEVANRGITQGQGLLFEADSFSLVGNDTREVSRSTLFDLGYTFAWAGWQGDLRPEEFGLSVPVVPVTGLVRATHFLGFRRPSLEGGSFGDQAGCAADANDPAAVLRIHTSLEDPGRIVPRQEWRFAKRGADGQVVADPCAFLLSRPLDRPGLVSIVFQAPPPPLISLGEAAVRDFASHLKNGDRSSALNARPGDARRVIAYGYSQAARFLRDFLYRGFNADERRRRVFDGVLDAAGGAGRGSFNHRYARPSEAGNSVGSILRAVDLYPFADLPAPDLAGGDRTEGLLDRPRRDQVQPRIFHLLNSSEYWARAGSLMHTTTDGRGTVPEAEGTRTYAFSGTAHGPRRHTLFLERAVHADLPHNDNVDLGLALPALVVALDRWIAADAEPPPSRVPQLGSTLVAPAELRFPVIPGVTLPAGPPPVWQLRLGPLYRSQGIIAEPPQLGARYPLLVPQVDEDGNELGSWRGLTSSVPLGTYTAWNPENPAMAPFGYLSGLQGAFIPFPATRAQREAGNDPRRSVAERYVGVDGYMAAVDRAIDAQIAAGFLLPQERERARTAMRINWDRVAGLRIHWPRPAS
ncbi:MAG TPA: alpha/beta hydrolase domain-containing protein [Allosphingosinicella sp.]